MEELRRQGGKLPLVMEYVSGKTLDHLIPKKGLNLNETLKYSTQIADALSAAHAAGIIHRDIKPTNIMVTELGRVKVLDFGLAKLEEREEIGETESTLTARAVSEEGTVAGSAPYMSPEQAEGKKIDARSDIFSFGAVLYEMVTGQRAFQGATRASTMASILKSEPKPASQLTEVLPKELDRIIARCLRKDLERRSQSIAEIKLALDELREESASGLQPAAAPSRRRWLLTALATAVVAGVLGIVWVRISVKQNTHQLHLRPLTDDSGLTTTPAISTDGRLVAYASDRASEGNLDIWVQPLTPGARPIRLTDHPAQDSTPAFSPDGGQIVFRSEREGGAIYVVPSLGGESRLLVRGAFDPRFSPDGQTIAYGSGPGWLMASNVFVVPAGGGTPQQVAADLPWAGKPVWSPDGQSLLLLGMKGIGDPISDYWVAPVRGGAAEKIGLAQFLRENKLSHFQDFEWHGRSLLFAAGSDVWAIDLDPGSRRPRQLRRLTTGTASLGVARGTPSRFVFSALSFSQHLWMLPLDPRTGRLTGQIQPLPHSGGSQNMPASSYDGGLIVYSQWNPSGGELRVRETSSGRETVLVTKYARPKMSPDGTKVAYWLNEKTSGGEGIYLMDSSGGQAQKLLGQPSILYGWTADGNHLVFYRTSPIRWFTFDLRSRQEKELLFHPQRVIHGVEPSPDLHWAAFNTKGEVNESLFIAPVRGGRAAEESEWITIAKGPGANERPWWSPDGNLLYFLSDKDGHECIWGQRLNPATKHPAGETFAVYHCHDPRRTPQSKNGLAVFGPAVSKDRLFFSLSEVTGNVWIAEEGN